MKPKQKDSLGSFVERRISGAILGALVPVITFVALSAVLFSIGGFRTGISFGVVWSHLGYISIGTAALGATIGFDRMLNLISPVWEAITWLWNKDREWDQRISEFIWEYAFSLLFVGTIVALVYFYAVR